MVRTTRLYLVRSLATRKVLAWRVRRCEGAIERAVGFLTRRAIAPEEGLWFEGCGAIHTLGMRVPLDVVFLDREGAVVRTEEQVPPHRLYVGARGSHIVAEFGPGFLRANSLAPGERLALEEI